MEEIIAKLKEYLAMDTEIDFKEFDEYYRKLIEKLNSDYQEMSHEDLLNMRYVLNTVAVNAENRSLRKDKFAKKYRKIQEKANFWSNAITYKAKKEWGYTDSTLEEADQRIDEAMRPAE